VLRGIADGVRSQSKTLRVQGSDSAAVEALRDIFAGSLGACRNQPPVFYGTSPTSGKSILVYPRSEEDVEDMPIPHEYLASSSHLGRHREFGAMGSGERLAESSEEDSAETDAEYAMPSGVGPYLNHLHSTPAQQDDSQDDDEDAAQAGPSPAGRQSRVGIHGAQGSNEVDCPPAGPSHEPGRFFSGWRQENADFRSPGGGHVPAPVTPPGTPSVRYLYEQDGFPVQHASPELFYRLGAAANGHALLDNPGLFQPYAGGGLYPYPLGHVGIPPPPPHRPLPPNFSGDLFAPCTGKERCENSLLRLCAAKVRAKGMRIRCPPP
jgi:hypothetical protein